MAVTTLTVTSSFTNYSDDRLKHNEVVIANGLDVIDKLCPKFYQKTLTMLDAHYNGDLSGLAWIYEAGLIAQEVLQIPDISFAVSGGDYYESVMRYDLSYNDLSYNDSSYNLRPPNTSGYYYEVSKNLINC
jgi:phage tail protein X